MKKLIKINSLLQIISLSLFIIFCISFLFNNNYTDTFLTYYASIQFFPALVKLFKLFNIVFPGIIILTFLFGRFYCSTICPLGAFQDCVGITGYKKKYKFRKSNYFIRFFIPVISICLFFFSIPLILNIFEPYSASFRLANNLLLPFGNRKNNFFILDVSLVTSILLFIFIIVLSFFRGRIYCNSICPAGAILSIPAKISVFKIRIDNTKCTSCGKCEYVCKAECINPKEKTIDNSKCVLCFNCLSACKFDALKYSGKPLNNKNLKTSNTSKNKNLNFKRRTFIGLGVTAIITFPLSKLNALKNNKTVPVTPPGSTGLKHFTETCTACQLCATQCPTGVLRPSFFEYGVTRMLQPHLDFKYGCCDYNCVKCAEICPTGAISPLSLEKKQKTSLGNAEINENICVVYKNETSCAACQEICPTGAIYMIDYKNGLHAPKINRELCIGCGACEHACPTIPKKAIQINAFAEHQMIKELPTKEHPEMTESEKDFAF